MKKQNVWLILLVLAVMLSGCKMESLPPDSAASPAITEQTLDNTAQAAQTDAPTDSRETEETTEPVGGIPESGEVSAFALSDVPPFFGFPYAEVNGNVPFFRQEELKDQSFEIYGQLDELGRCTAAYASVGPDLMPTEERGEIGQIKPAGWHTIKYDCVDGKYLYNRCHLIGYQLTGENSNVNNLMTGTRYLNMEGMLPFENRVADYINETGNHVMYRVTPIYEGRNLLSHGVLMEGMSVEDQGAGLCFCIFAYNAQPGVNIDYTDGSSSGIEPETESAELASAEAQTLEPELSETTSPVTEMAGGEEYVLNTNTGKFHKPSCSSVKRMKQSNKEIFQGPREQVIAQGYTPCKNCNP